MNEKRRRPDFGAAFRFGLRCAPFRLRRSLRPAIMAYGQIMWLACGKPAVCLVGGYAPNTPRIGRGGKEGVRTPLLLLLLRSWSPLRFGSPSHPHPPPGAS